MANIKRNNSIRENLNFELLESFQPLQFYDSLKLSIENLNQTDFDITRQLIVSSITDLISELVNKRLWEIKIRVEHNSIPSIKLQLRSN